jgi:hypothetical protein
MDDMVSKSSLLPCKRRLLEIMQTLNFGTIESLAVASGKPVLDPPPKITREVKFGAENGARPESSFEDFVLKVQVRELFDAIFEIGDGVIDRIEIRHGLPFRMMLTARNGGQP